VESKVEKAKEGRKLCLSVVVQNQKMQQGSDNYELLVGVGGELQIGTK